MKLAVLLLVVAFHVSAKGISQITLSETNTPLEKVFNAIEKQSGFVFFYDYAWLDEAKTVSIKVKNASLTEVLNACFKDQPLTYSVIGKTIVVKQKAAIEVFIPAPPLPPHIVKGIVTDEKGQPLAGVSVMVKGSTQGTRTNEGGEYTTAKIPENAILQFSFIGMKTEERAVRNLSVIDVTMTMESNTLEEVVAVGYGLTTTREKLTGSIATVQPKFLTDRGPVTTPLGLITGLATNVRVTTSTSLPGTDPTIQIREASSWKGGEGVLYVIDGAIRDQQAFQAMNPNDIASLSILKDAASAAIYGMKAGEGVILITTKMGAAGKTTVNYGFSYSSNSPIILAKKQTAYEYATSINGYLKMMGYPADAKQWYLPNELDYFKNNNSNSLDEFWSNPRSKNHNISASGGNDKSKYFISGSWNTTDQSTFGIKYEKYTILAKFENKFTDRLTFNFNMYASWDKNYRPGGDVNGSGLSFGSLLMRTSTNPYYKVIDGVKYPLDPTIAKVMFQDAGFSSFNNASIDPRASLKYRIPGIKGLSANVQFAYRNNFYKDKFWDVSPYYYNIIFDRHIPTDQFNYSAATGWKARNAQGNNTFASLTQNYKSADSYQGNYQFTYANHFGAHNISALAGYEFRGSKGDYIMAYRRGFALESYNQLAGGSSDVQNMNTGGDITNQNGMASWIGRLDYDYDGKYILGATFRRDGSYKFSPDQRWGNFPAVSAAWIVSKESFFKPVESVINFFKIRGSFGKTGTDNTNPWQWRDAFASGSQLTLGSDVISTLNTSVVPNPFITWEKNTNYNVGADFGLFNNHLNFSIEGWYTKTTDILSNRTILTPSIVGANLPDVNYGVMSAQGTEFTFNYSNKIGKLNFSLGGNIAYNVNKILVMDEAPNLRPYESMVNHPTYRIRNWNILVNETGNGVIRTMIEGERIMAENGVGATHYGTIQSFMTPGSVFAQDHFGSAGGLFRDSPDGNVNQNGQDDKVWFANKYNTPRMPFGINASLSYQGIELNMIAAGVGFYHRQWDRGIVGLGNFTNLWGDEWTFSNINGGGATPLGAGLFGPDGLNLPSTGTDKPSTLNLYNATFLRMKNISLAYNIPANIMRKAGIAGLKVYANMENPFMIFKLCPKQFDPESAQGNLYPILRNYSLGVNITL